MSEENQWRGRMEQKLDDLCYQFKNHLKHHWTLECALVVGLLGLLIKVYIGG